MPDDHSEVVPLLPIPNRTVKRLCADDSADSRVKVGHRQALTAANAQQKCWAFCFGQKRFNAEACKPKCNWLGARCSAVPGPLGRGTGSPVTRPDICGS